MGENVARWVSRHDEEASRSPRPRERACILSSRFGVSALRSKMDFGRSDEATGEYHTQGRAVVKAVH